MLSRLAGYLIAVRDGDSLHLANLAVNQAYRRKGVGRALVCRLIEEAYGTGYSSIHLEVRQSNEIAIALYRNLGFKTTAIAENYYEGVEDALIMSVESYGMVQQG